MTSPPAAAAVVDPHGGDGAVVQVNTSFSHDSGYFSVIMAWLE
ncbi:hypothetical protein Hdeb2414_s0003g00107321 [Helianthus debilis subsp. tardiflorus]